MVHSGLALVAGLGGSVVEDLRDRGDVSLEDSGRQNQKFWLGSRLAGPWGTRLGPGLRRLGGRSELWFRWKTAKNTLKREL